MTDEKAKPRKLRDLALERELSGRAEVDGE